MTDSPRAINNSRFARWLVERCDYEARVRIGDTIRLSTNDPNSIRDISKEDVDEPTWNFLLELLPESQNPAQVAGLLIEQSVPESRLDGGRTSLRSVIASWAAHTDELVSNESTASSGRSSSQNDVPLEAVREQTSEQENSDEKKTRSEAKTTNTRSLVFRCGSRSQSGVLTAPHNTFGCGRKTLRERMEEEKTQMEREHEDAILVAPVSKKKVERARGFQI